MHRLIGIGAALVDVLAFVPEEFVAAIPGAKGGMELLDRDAMQRLLADLPGSPSRVPGGSAANTCVGAAKLGLPVRLLSKIGDDPGGALYRNHMERDGVSTETLKVHPNEATGTCICLVTPDSERTMRTYLGASATLAADEITERDFAGCTQVHVEGFLLFNQDVMLHVLQTAKKAGCRISLDLASLEVVRSARMLLPGLLREYVDIVLANEDEAAAFAGGSDAREGLAKLAAFCPLTAVKLGARGAVIRHNGRTVEVPAQRVTAVDTTGAGDYWAAGFLYGLLTGRDLPEAGTLAAAVAAAVVQETGARISEQRWTQLKRELAIAPTE